MIGICEECGLEAGLDKHHKDKDRGNNKPDNVAILCRWCHRAADGKQSHRPIGFNEVRRQYTSCFPRA